LTALDSGLEWLNVDWHQRRLYAILFDDWLG